MRPSDRDLTPIGPFRRGVDNMSGETDVGLRSLREAVNVNVSDTGRVSRRDGYTLVSTMSASDIVGVGNRGFIAADGTLLTFDVADFGIGAITEIMEGVGEHLCVALIEPDIFMSDGERNFRIAPDNTITPWALDEPMPPAVAALNNQGGGMAAGTYQMAMSNAPVGEAESALSERVVFAIGTGEYPSIDLPLTGHRRALYMTKADGTELLLVAYVPADVPGINVMQPQLGRPPVTEDTAAMPACSAALYYRGRLWVATQNWLTTSLPFQYTVTALEDGTMALMEPITGLGSCGDAGGGFFIGQQSRVYYAQGDSPNELTLLERYPAGMVAGTLKMVPGAQLPMQAPPSEQVPMWMATDGVFCVGLPDGTVLPLTERYFVAANAKRGAAMMQRRKGESRYIATVEEPRDNVFAASDELTIEIVRNGIPVTV